MFGLLRTQGVTNVALLTVANALAFSATPFIMFIGSLLGTQLAPTSTLATLPIACMVIGVSVGVWPVTRIMQRLGRKKGLLMFVVVGCVAGLLAAEALVWSSFTLFCCATALLGVCNAALQQMRFAALESVDSDYGSTALSVLMCDGIVAAFMGPEIGVMGRHWTPIEYQGSFWLLCLFFVAALIVLGFSRDMYSVNRDSSEPSQAVSLGYFFKNLVFCLALASAGVSYVVMSFIMTATPISMHHHHGHSLEDTKWVIQWHIAAMFLPSLIAPFLLRWFSLRGLIMVGALFFLMTIVIGFSDQSVMGFWLQLVLLGVGWNFLFLSGTSLLPQSYEASQAYRAQGINDTLVFGLQALASLSAGWVVMQLSWSTLLLYSGLPVFGLLFLMFWERAQRT